MLEIEVKDINNNTVEKSELPGSVFGLEIRQDILHSAVRNYLANRRQGTHATKTKGLVRGGGKKPWRQKHTGRARHGSIRSPLWKGGGVTFGPHPRDYYYKLPKKVKKLALKTALSTKYSEDEIICIDSLQIDKPKTKEMIRILKNLALESKSVLIVLPEKDENVLFASRNIIGVHVARVQDLHTYDVLAHDRLLITMDALQTIKGLNNEGSSHNN